MPRRRAAGSRTPSERLQQGQAVEAPARAPESQRARGRVAKKGGTRKYSLPKAEAPSDRPTAPRGSEPHDGRNLERIEETARGLLAQPDRFWAGVRQIIAEDLPVEAKTEKVTRLREKVFGKIEALLAKFDEEDRAKEKELQDQMARLRQVRQQVTVIRHAMQTANPCRACGMALWVAGKDARGRWIEVNLDGSPHICPAPMTGLSRSLLQVASRRPAMPPSAIPQQGVAAPPRPLLQPVVGQGWPRLERFILAVALAVLVFLAATSWGARNGLWGFREQAAQPAAQRAAGTPGRPEPPHKSYFGLGSTEEGVMAVMGPPREIVDNRWYYGSSYVDFRNGRVVNFYNGLQGDLKVKMPGPARKRPPYLAKGLTKEEVLTLQGTPTRLAGNRWHYGSSYVEFQEDQVADYFNGAQKELKIFSRSGPR